MGFVSTKNIKPHLLYSGMIDFRASNKIYVSDSKIAKAGRGVFSNAYIKKGEIIEECPIIEIPKGDLTSINQSILFTYFFYFGEKKEKALLALGFGSLYNHSYSPNARYEINEDDKTLVITAVKNIKKDEEITFNYKGNDKTSTPLWFEESIHANK